MGSGRTEQMIFSTVCRRPWAVAASLMALTAACRPGPPPRGRPEGDLVRLSRIVWIPEADRVPDVHAIGDSAKLTIVVVETGQIDSCVLTRDGARAYVCLGGLPPIPLTPDGPDNLVTVGWASGETGYGVVLNGEAIDRVSERYDGFSQGRFRIVDKAGHIE